MQQNCRRVLNLSGCWLFCMVDSFALCWKIMLYAFASCWKIMLTPSGECPWEGLAIYSCARSAISEGCNIQVWNIQGRNLLTHNVAFVLKPKGLLFRDLPMLWGWLALVVLLKTFPCFFCLAFVVLPRQKTRTHVPILVARHILLCHRLRATWQ
jgi:hypothetical protein